MTHTGEQVRDLLRLASAGADGGLGKQHRLAGEQPYLGNRLAEDAVEVF
jgi:hypothetical protein